MVNELSRKILKTILEEKKPIANKDLAIRCDAAINTIRKEIILINEDVKKHGFQIVSKTSVGSYIEITDPELANPYIEWLRDRYKRNQRMDNRYPSRIYYLTRRFLCSNGNLTVEGLCQELYCSRGSLLRDLDMVKKILKRYDLTLKNKRGKLGLIVEGDEWNIRQCLVYQHKIFMNQIEEAEYKEYAFKALFFMMEGIDHYEIARTYLLECLAEQHDFTLPIIHFPKIIHHMQLGLTRQKQTANLRFTEEQVQRAYNTPEYAVAQKLYKRLGEHMKKTVLEQDILALSMLLLSYESQNFGLKSMEEYQEYYEETQELIHRFSSYWGYPREIFDEMFVEDWICFLYTLRNRQIFHVYLDREILGDIEHKGIRSADFCIEFARYYEEKHGIRLSHEDTLSAFYLFHRLLKRDAYCYYAQNILVISQYGIRCAKSLAMNIRRGYDTEVGKITAGEMGEYIAEEQEEYDLLMTDLGPGRRRYLEVYNLPILTVEFLPFQYRCPELDDYLRQVQHKCEWTVIKENCFHYTNLKSKEDVYEYLAELLASSGIEKERLTCHMRENDSYVELEREKGVVFLPILLQGMQQQEIHVLINRRSFVWNENHSQIFVCYNRINSLKANQMLNGILRRFVHMSVETAAGLIRETGSAMQVLYAKEIV